MRTFSRPARPAPPRPLSETLRPATRPAPGERARPGVLRPLVALAALLLGAALLLPRDQPPAVPGDGLRPITAAGSATPAGSAAPADPAGAVATDQSPAGTSSASVVPAAGASDDPTPTHAPKSRHPTRASRNPTHRRTSRPLDPTPAPGGPPAATARPPAAATASPARRTTAPRRTPSRSSSQPSAAATEFGP